jgi:dihydrofolate reductase
MTLDGVVQDPQNWSFPYWNEETQKFKEEEIEKTDALLLGRVTYEAFAAAWPSRKGMGRTPAITQCTRLHLRALIKQLAPIQKVAAVQSAPAKPERNPSLTLDNGYQNI